MNAAFSGIFHLFEGLGNNRQIVAIAVSHGTVYCSIRNVEDQRLLLGSVREV